jgi:hypothetical protein
MSLWRPSDSIRARHSGAQWFGIHRRSASAANQRETRTAQKNESGREFVEAATTRDGVEELNTATEIHDEIEVILVLREITQ